MATFLAKLLAIWLYFWRQGISSNGFKSRCSTTIIYGFNEIYRKVERNDSKTVIEFSSLCVFKEFPLHQAELVVCQKFGSCELYVITLFLVP